MARANSASNDRAWRPAPPTQCGHQLNIKSITDSYLGCHSSSCHCRVASADIGVPIWLGLLHWPFPQAQPGPCPVYPSSVLCPRAALTWVCQPCWCLPGHSTTALHTPKPPTLTGSTPTCQHQILQGHSPLSCSPGETPALRWQRSRTLRRIPARRGSQVRAPQGMAAQDAHHTKRGTTRSTAGELTPPFRFIPVSRG